MTNPTGPDVTTRNLDTIGVAPQMATRTPVPVTRSIATARAFTVRTMQKWGADSRGDDAAAVVTELMTNALRHALAELPADAGFPADGELPADRRGSSAWPIRL